ncbi:MAG: hypothetical protein IT236_15760, partial [Bacteroidia bacterium]|nr:hypothetical protein [Bacteroidia bacterium]
KKIIFGIVTITRATVNADVLVSKPVSTSPFTVEFNQTITPYMALTNADVAKDTSKYNGKELANGDTVLYTYKNVPYQQYVVSSLDKESVILNAMGKDYPTILVPLKSNTFYIQNRNMRTLKCGEEVKIEVKDTFDNSTLKTNARICGFCNNTHVLLKSNHGYHSLTLDKISK